MIKDTFKEFVDQKVSEASKEPVDWGKEKDDWLFKLAQLHIQIISWLTPYVTNQSVQIGQEMVSLVEENIGSYQAPMTTITIGKSHVKLEPIGTLLIGARGRVDMKGPNGVARLVIVPKESTGPSVRVNVILPGQPQLPSPRVEPPPVSEWVWKFASSPPRIAYTELNKESFLEALMGVANG